MHNHIYIYQSLNNRYKIVIDNLSLQNIFFLNMRRNELIQAPNYISKLFIIEIIKKIEEMYSDVLNNEIFIKDQLRIIGRKPGFAIVTCFGSKKNKKGTILELLKLIYEIDVHNFDFSLSADKTELLITTEKVPVIYRTFRSKKENNDRWIGFISAFYEGVIIGAMLHLGINVCLTSHSIRADKMSIKIVTHESLQSEEWIKKK